MNILYISLHNLDLSKDEPLRKDISTDFNAFIGNYINETLAGTTSREYTVQDYDRTVAHCISEIYLDALRQGDVFVNRENVISLTDSIAKKLLDSEKSAQEKVKGIASIQKGSIVQSLVRVEDGYIYIIAKVEHSEWYDVDSFVKKYGIPGSIKNVWKSAVIKVDQIEDSVLFTSIKCYVDTEAKYWTDSFLEVQEAKSNSTNTRAVMKAFDSILVQLKADSPIDYYNLKNTVNHELQSDQLINYPEMVGKLLDNYIPNSESVDPNALKEKLLSLADGARFDTQFQTDPRELKRLVKIRIKVSPSIDILIKDPQGDWKSSLLIRRKPDGKNYLMIRCEDPKTLASFPEDE